MSENNFGMGIQIEQQVQYSKPVDIMQSKLIRDKNKDHPFISYLNVNSLRNKIHDIRTMIHDITPEVFTVSETKIDNTFPDAQFMIDGYHDPGDFRKDRNKNGGGLITYIKRGIPHKRLTKMEPADLEITCIELTFGRRKWGYVAIYRPPHEKIKTFFDGIAKCLEQLTNNYDRLIIAGDININTNDDTSSGYQIYRNFLDTFALKNLIRSDTCYTRRNEIDTSSSLDVFLTNSATSFFNTHTTTTGISDCHSLVGSLLRATYKRLKPYEIQYRNYENLYQDFESFKRDIQNIDANMSDIDKREPNKYYNTFTKHFQDTLDRYAPLKKKKIRGNDGGFANKELRKAWYNRSRLKNKYNRNQTDQNWFNFKKQRNLCTSLKRKAKKAFFITKSMDRESFWKIFGPYITNKGHHSREDYIVSVDDELISDKKTVANIFNNYYINIIENTTGNKLDEFILEDAGSGVDQITEIYKNHPSISMIKKKMSEFDELDIFRMPKATESDIYDIIIKMNVKSSQGYDKIPPKVLKMCANEIAEPLTNIINASIRSNVFPDEAKISLCTPLYKNPTHGNRHNITNYRPINICTSFSKILERYFLNSILEHVNKILSIHITAYRKGHGCQHVLLKLTEDWRKYIDQNKVVGGLLMDLSKAFDCLPHELLIAKLEAYGFDKGTLNLLYSYLKNRKQAVKINGLLSDFLEILSGVPQGSILGPILFNIFINDFIYHMEGTAANVLNFADDNTLSAFAENTHELKRILDNAAIEATTWLESNKMIANPDKFKAIVLGKSNLKSNDVTINVGNLNVKPDASVKLLGLQIDDKLNFRAYIQNLCKKAGAKLNAIKRLTFYLEEKERKLLVDTHVISYFSYASTVWHFCGLSDIHKMEKLHERCIRFIYNEYDKNYFKLLNEKKLNTLFGKRTLAMCCETYKTVHDLNAAYMKDILCQRPSKYPSRNADDLYVPKVNQITYGHKSYRVQGPKMWNCLPNELKQINSYDTFRNRIGDITMPFCSCESCLLLQKEISSSSPLVDKMLHDILMNK